MVSLLPKRPVNKVRSCMIRRFSLAVLVAAICLPAVASAEWGNLKGQFVFDGTPPKQPEITVTKDVEFCGKFDLLAENVVVDPDSKGIANVVVYLYPGRRQKVEVHPSYEAAAKEPVAFDNIGCRFEPHIVTLMTGQTLKIGNKDAVGHNTKMDCLSNAPINPIIPANQTLEQTFSKEERLPVTVSCNIHPWMTARVVIKEHPYMAVSGADGTFEIKNLPAGEWTFQVWHEESGYVQDVKLGGKKTEWSKGRFDLEIESGDNDLGVVGFAP